MCRVAQSDAVSICGHKTFDSLSWGIGEPQDAINGDGRCRWRSMRAFLKGAQGTAVMAW